MLDYKHRKIELTPRRQADGTWHCQYRIIEFRETCWGYRQGYPEGIFASRDAAVSIALEEAKRIVDMLECPIQDPLSESDSVLATYASRMGKLFAWAR
ncbi:MAG: hypothetical protein H8K03_19730 [Nitrospira sp.]|jgi:hypothetical protein|nr:hypothetical protein [Nitrospira sp. BO4]